MIEFLISILLLSLLLCYIYDNIFSYFLLITVLSKIYLKFTLGKCENKRELNGKTVIITGANSGIGKETAVDLAARGAKIILACRNLKLGNQTKDEIVERTRNQNIILEQLDLESLESVREFCKRIYARENQLDILINNAGASGLGNIFTKDGFHVGMQVNYFGPFLLTYLLLDLLKKSAPSRIVNVASDAHFLTSLSYKNLKNDPDYLNKHHNFFGFDLLNYSNSKFCNIIMSNKFAKILKGTGVTSNSLHPGAVSTGLFKYMRWWYRWGAELGSLIYFKTAEEGAQTSIYLAVSEDVEQITGKYFADCKERWYLWKDEKMENLVWEQTLNYLKKHIDDFKNN